MTSKSDVQKWRSEVKSKNYVQMWSSKVRFKSVVQKWGPNETSQREVKKWRPKLTFKSDAERWHGSAHVEGFCVSYIRNLKKRKKDFFGFSEHVFELSKVYFLSYHV